MKGYNKMINNLAVVTTPTPTPDPPIQEDCVYQIKIDQNVYQCLTQNQWDARQTQIANEHAIANARIDSFFGMLGANWWVIMPLIVCLIIVQKLWRRKHPKEPNFLCDNYYKPELRYTKINNKEQLIKYKENK